MRQFHALLLLITANLLGCASSVPSRPPRDFHFSPVGNDGAGDGSAQKPFASLTKAGSLTLAPGDRLLLQGGATFSGTLALEDLDGTKDQPVTIATYGQGRATIAAGEGFGVLARNCSHLIVKDLIVAGSGPDTNVSSGVAVINGKRRGLARKQLQNIRIHNVEAHGFALEGIHIDARNGNGFDHVHITDCVARDNGHCGIYVSGHRETTGRYGHRFVNITRCRAFRNLGNPYERDENRSGSGIFLTGVDQALVEHCLAYENGRLCRAQKGGPMGIWTSESNRLTIQYCESHSNRTGGRHDGGGFGIDGGCTNCVLQHNYSHDNEGSGYGLFQYAYAKAWRNNLVRYNRSENDGRRNGYAGIHVWNGGSGMRGAVIHDNKVVIRTPGGRGKMGEPGRALWVQSPVEKLRVLRNSLSAPEPVTLMDVAPGQKDALFSQNVLAR